MSLDIYGAGITRIGSLLNRKVISVFQLVSSTVMANTVISSSHRQSKVVLFFCPGFLIDSKFYSSYLKLLNPAKAFVFAQLDNSTFTEEANSLVNEVINQVAEDCKIVLMGHSRGGAVVSIALCLLAQRKMNLQENNIFTVLLDPVDTAEHTALSFIRNCKTNSLTKALLVSTPYGGTSSYYKVNYESSCAPNSRNSDAFFAAFELKNNVDITYAVLPNVGHLQLLDDGFSSASICAPGKFIKTLILTWFSSVSGQDYVQKKASDKYAIKTKIMSKVESMFPGISTWTF